MISFPCPQCGKTLRVDDDLAGKRGKCPGCRAGVVVPLAAASRRTPRQGDSSHRLVDESDLNTLPPVLPQGLEQPIPESASWSDDAQVDTHPPRSGKRGPVSNELRDFLAPAQAPDEIGRLGPYRVLEVLGSGGMGVVYRAEDPALQRRVALKAMLPTLASSESARQRFLREARTAAAIGHDHIVTIYQVGEDRGVPYLAMQFLEGESLEDCLRRSAPLPLRDLLRIGRETALGLAAAHDRGLVHRDIKPANLWLEARGERREARATRVKILDFGLARSAGGESNLTQQGAILGTPSYMAPEQASGQPVDARADLFALGCVLYRAATGSLPFKGTDAVSTLVAVATEAPDPPDQLNSDLPRELVQLILQLLAKKPRERPKSAHLVAESLAALEGKLAANTLVRSQRTAAVTAEVVPVVAEVRKRRRGSSRRGRGDSRLVPAAIGVGALLASLLVLALVLYIRSRPGPVPSGPGPDVALANPSPRSDPLPGADKPKLLLPQLPTPAKPVPEPAPPPAAKPGPPPMDSKQATAILLGKLRETVRAGQFQRTRQMGSGKDEYEEVPRQGAVLIGFEFTFGYFGKNQTLKTIRPTFLGVEGRITGITHGVPGREMYRIEADPGYAVGAVTIKAGAGIDGMSVTFMEIQAGGLNPARAYESDWIGGMGGGPKTTIGGNGAPVVGIFGKTAATRSSTFNGLGLVTANLVE